MSTREYQIPYGYVVYGGLCIPKELAISLTSKIKEQ